MGWYVGICILMGVFAGIWLDGKFDTEPALAIAGLIFGIIVAFYGVYRMLLPFIGDKEDKGE